TGATVVCVLHPANPGTSRARIKQAAEYFGNFIGQSVAAERAPIFRALQMPPVCFGTRWCCQNERRSSSGGALLKIETLRCLSQQCLAQAPHQRQLKASI